MWERLNPLGEGAGGGSPSYSSVGEQMAPTAARADLCWGL